MTERSYLCARFVCCNVHPVTERKQLEIDRFEELVIEGGPVALPGAAALISQVHPG